MSERDDFEAAVRTVLPELPHLKSYGALVLKDNGDGTIDVRCDDADVGELQGVLLLADGPGTKLTVTPGTDRVRILFASAKPGAYYAIGFEQNRDADKDLATVGSTVDCGTLTATAPPGGGPVTFTYTPPSGTPGAPGLTVQLQGVVTSGDPKTKKKPT